MTMNHHVVLLSAATASIAAAYICDKMHARSLDRGAKKLVEQYADHRVIEVDFRSRNS
jgi:hypothetical protein